MDVREAELKHWEGQLEAELAGQAERTEAERDLLDRTAAEMKRLREAFEQGEPFDFAKVRQMFAQLDDEGGIAGGPPIS